MIETLKGKDLENTAYAISAEAHLPQQYNYNPYITHPVEVALLAKIHGYGSEVVAGCYLHDTEEDTDVTSEFLIAKGIPLVVVEGVEAVTFTDLDKRNGVDKIAKAKSHPIGHVIKFCDSSRNFATSVTSPEILEMERKGKARDFSLRYAGYLSLLIIDLPTPEEIQEYLVARGN